MTIIAVVISMNQPQLVLSIKLLEKKIFFSFNFFALKAQSDLFLGQLF